nr:MAG TPA: hypothetical protein [Caudoviricetes sp.]
MLKTSTKISNRKLLIMTEVNELKKEYESLLERVVQLPRSRELSLVITKLEEGLMWLEKSIKQQEIQK